MYIRLWIVALLVAVALGGVAEAATVETRVKLLVRERPSASARITDRLGAGVKLQVLGRSGDGEWTHVKGGPRGRDGWVPTDQLSGKVKGRRTVETDEGEDEEVQRPLAKRRSVRPEAWVSKSRYHDGEDTKLVVSAVKAELYGRPQTGGSVLGVLRRGEQVNLVRRSSDKKWILVDIGGGDVAWIMAKAVVPGKAKAVAQPSDEPDEPDEPPPPPPKKEDKKKKVAAAPEPEPEPEEAPPPPPKKEDKKKKGEKVAKAEEKAVDIDKLEDEEAPMPERKAEEPEPKAKKKKEKPVKVASRGSVGLGAAGSVSRPRPSDKSKNHIIAAVRAGIARMETRFISNGTGALSNYESVTTGAAIHLTLGYQRSLGKMFRLGALLNGGGVFGGAVQYLGTAVNETLGVQSWYFDASLKPGLHFNVIGGLNLDLLVGAFANLNLVQQSLTVPLPSDLVVGANVGIALEAPAVLYRGRGALGVRVFGTFVGGQRQQTGGLEDGGGGQTLGGQFGGGLSYVFPLEVKGTYRGAPGIDLYYSGFLMVTQFEGQSNRNLTITQATRGNAQHMIMLGIRYDL
jgi:hypothetical protein